MSLLHAVGAIVQFEWRRSRAWKRLLAWFALVAFPVVNVLVLRAALTRPPDPRLWIFTLFYLITEFTTCMGMLLCVAPAVHLELEYRTWIYVATRPAGRHALLIGKYLWALIWTLSASWTALLLAVSLCEPPDRFRTWWVLAVLSAFSAMGRGAVYAWLAVAFPNRAMALSVVYTAVFDYLVGWIPALINKFTVQFHVRCLLMRWLDLERWIGRVRWVFDDRPAWEHLTALVVFTAVFLVVAWQWIDRRQFTSSQEG
ncbi:MAG: hypothetical protein KatS3mg110_4248 [Pirellulaceae bacterium]|nr:MAG: hypothetical protein KatS3mg110_4248 [Pirellulaceae bacterium]